MPDAFAKITPHYKGRMHYAPKLFEMLASEMELGPSARILDVCCGQGELAKGFSPYVGEVVALDKSEAMLSAAGENAPTNIVFRKAEIGGGKNLELGRFDAISIGRGLRYLPRDPTMTFFERTLPEGSAVINCGSTISDETPWRKTYNGVRQKYGHRPGAHSFRDDNYFANSPFEHYKTVLARDQISYSLDSLVDTALSFRSSYERIASNIPAFRNELEKALEPFLNEDGVLKGKMISAGNIYRKK